MTPTRENRTEERRITLVVLDLTSISKYTADAQGTAETVAVKIADLPRSLRG
ncbi:hypothetical protein ACWGJB_29150 [Streptomyces sp. NPDC054813]